MADTLKQFNDDALMYLFIMYRDLAMVFYSKQEFNSALFCFKEALNYLEENCNRLDKEKANLEVIENFEKHMLEIKERILELSSDSNNLKFEKNNFFNKIEHYKKFLCEASTQEEGYYNLGRYLYEMGAFNSAILFFEEVLNKNPQNTATLRFLGDIYHQHLKNSQKAIMYYEKYIEKNPSDYFILHQIGYLYQVLDPYGDIQIKYFEKALALKPDFLCAVQNLAVAYERFGNYNRALEYYNKLFEYKDSMDRFFDYSYNYGCLNLKLKNFEEGWKHFESRFLSETKLVLYPKIKESKWQGEDIKNKTLLVHYELGFGDTICFCRYVQQLKGVAGKIIFRVQNELFDLLKSNLDDIEIIDMSTPLEEISFDYHIPLMSLPYILNANAGNIPLAKGYLKADKSKSEVYKEKYFNNDCFKIGIAWQGSETAGNLRNVPLETFYPLMKFKNIKIYSFQKGDCAEKLKELPPDVEIIDLGQTFGSFDDTAAAMDNIDLFISSDNSLVNLAGALGKKTFLMLRQNAEWRWFLEDENSPWYDSFTLFRKKSEKDYWAFLMQKIMEKVLIITKN